MKIKNIMLITFLLLAVLTIGAVSASDNAASDNITVSDDTDVNAVDEEDLYEDYDISIEEDYKICIDPDNDEYDDTEEIAWLDVYTDTPKDIKGSFQVWKNSDKILHLNISLDDEHWEHEYDEDDDEGILTGTIFLKDLDLNKINNGDILSFKYCDENNNEIKSLTIFGKVTIANNYLTLTDTEYEPEDDVEATYYTDDPIIMEEGWDEEKFVEFEINDINGRIVIYLNETLKFNKTLTEIDNESDKYIILLRDLNINKPGEYSITSYFYDNDGNLIYNSTEVEDEKLILSLYEPQIEIIDNVKITIIGVPTILNNTDTLITLNSSASKGDNITIYVEGQEPITITITNNTRTEDGNYIIGSEELKLPKVAREYVLNITYKGKNITNKKINLISNIEIVLEEDTIFNNLDDGFVFISLREGDIKKAELEGKINITIKDNDGKTIATFEQDIGDINNPDEDEDDRVIYTDDLKSTVNGTYTVCVRYFDGDEAETQVERIMTFQTLTAEDYGTSIKDIVKDKNDSVITFKDLPLIDNICIEVNGKIIDDSYLDDLYDQEGNYYIKYDKLEGLKEGDSNSIIVYLEKNNKKFLDLASGNVFVDVEENFDINLNVNVANIEEGNDAIAIITTNNTFTGKVTVIVANVTYNVNVTNGKGNVSISGLKAGTYTATAISAYNGIFNASTKTTAFNVTPAKTTPSQDNQAKAAVIKLTLKKAKIKKSAKKLVLKAKLKINGKKVKGKKITFKFKGKTYKKKTNKKGVAKVTIKKKVLKKLKVGKKITYTAKYLNKKVKKTVKVKK